MSIDDHAHVEGTYDTHHPYQPARRVNSNLHDGGHVRTRVDGTRHPYATTAGTGRGLPAKGIGGRLQRAAAITGRVHRVMEEQDLRKSTAVINMPDVQYPHWKAP
jgi:hypothetical protein